jgi:hypothetical protein
LEVRFVLGVLLQKISPIVFGRDVEEKAMTTDHEHHHMKKA